MDTILLIFGLAESLQAGSNIFLVINDDFLILLQIAVLRERGEPKFSLELALKTGEFLPPS